MNEWTLVKRFVWFRNNFTFERHRQCPFSVDDVANNESSFWCFFFFFSLFSSPLIWMLNEFRFFLFSSVVTSLIVHRHSPSLINTSTKCIYSEWKIERNFLFYFIHIAPFIYLFYVYFVTNKKFFGFVFLLRRYSFRVTQFYFVSFRSVYKFLIITLCLMCIIHGKMLSTKHVRTERMSSRKRKIHFQMKKKWLHCYDTNWDERDMRNK